MHFRTIIDRIAQRCQALGLTQGDTGQIDVSAIELHLLHVMQGLAERHDFDTLTNIAEPMFVTRTGERTYRLPEDFGRLVTPQDDQTSGLLIDDGTNEYPLTYRDPELHRRQQSPTNQRPMYFTVLAWARIRLDPPPDGNGTNNPGYTGIGTYIQAITADILDGEVPFTHPASLVDMTLAQLAGDRSHPQSAFLLQQALRAESQLINHMRRMQQQFQSTSSRQWRWARRR